MGPRRHTPPAAAKIDRFAILEKIGSGGQAEVFAAYDPKLDRRVALKVLFASSAEGGADAREEVLREAQAMARLQHPAVVTVYDAGLTEGQVYLVLELIEGCTLAEWLVETDPKWRAALEVYVRVGEGLAAAHRVGVVHGDFKPGNVVMGPGGAPKIADFGLARVRGRDLPREEGASFEGTPAYMAPEQLEGRRTDARSDQFSFCVALYEGIFAQRPFRWDDEAELREAVLAGRVQPPPPDSRVPRGVRAAVLRGLARDPAARWPNMDALLARLRAPLRPRRRRGPWALALLLALTGGLGVGVLLRGRGAEDTCLARLETMESWWNEEPRARLAAAFASVEPEQGADTWARTERLLSRYADEWARRQKEACARAGSSQELEWSLCLERDAQAFVGFVRALEHPTRQTLRRAVTGAASLPDLDTCRLEGPRPEAVEQDPELAARLHGLRERLGQALGLQLAGDYEGGVTLAREILRDDDIGRDPALAAEARVRLGMLEHYAGDYRQALDDLREGAWAAEASGMDRLAALARTLVVHLAGRHLHERKQAQEWARHAQALLARLDPPEEPVEARLALYLAMLARDEGRPEEAQAHLERALEVRTRLFGPESLDVAVVLGELGAVHEARGQLDQAARAFGRGREIYAQVLGPAHPEAAEFLRGLGRVELARGDPARAVELLEEAAADYRAMREEGYPELGPVLVDLGRARMQQGKLGAATQALEEAVASLTHLYPADDTRVAEAYLELAEVRGEVGDVAGARRALARARPGVEAHHGPQDPAWERLATLRARLGEPAAAVEAPAP